MTSLELGVEKQPLRHIRIRVGELTLDYLAPAGQADDVARVLAGCSDPEVTVIVDDDVRAGLPSLPCAELWD